ncbi:MAG: 30S ribosomal protein S5 [Candidatus Aenigmarchaeota archaeon]|nr:30S ribosomal protein S5 [Candidatus Aenigmarchaeota archaeon]
MAEENETWIPKTNLGKEVAEGKITDIDEIFRRGLKIKEAEIVDKLIPALKSEIIFVGGSPGKGGGIKRTPTKRTARMHRSGRRYRMSAVVVVGDSNGHIGIGKATSQENVKAIGKATEEAKLNIMPVRRGCGSWECACAEEHSIPFEVQGKSGSVRIVLKPAPKGIKSCVSKEMRKIIELAGITDLWSKSFGNTRARMNMALAIIDAFKKMNAMKIDLEMEKSASEPEDTVVMKKKARKKKKGEE